MFRTIDPEDKRSFSAHSVFFFGVLAALAVNVWVLSMTMRRVSSEAERLTTAHEIMRQLDLVLSSAKDAETGLRGYLLTRKEEYLEPYNAGTTEIWEHLSRARTLIGADVALMSREKAIEVTIERRLALLEGLVERTRASVRVPGAKAGVIDGEAIRIGEGKTVMDALRSQISSAQGEVRRILDDRARDTESAKSIFFISLLLTTALTAIVVLSALSRVRADQMRAQTEARESARETRLQTALAELSRELVEDSEVGEFARRGMRFLILRTGALGGHFFAVHGRELARVASVARGAEAAENGKRPGADPRAGKRVSLGDGLIGEAVHRREFFEVNDVPAGYFPIGSSLGEANARSVWLMPLIFQARIVGVVELASFRAANEEERELLAKASESLAIGLNAAILRERQQELLEKTQQQTEEMQAQQEELRANNEELEEQARALETQQVELDRRNGELLSARDETLAKARDLEQASQYKSDFLAKMSHELRTPLNSLLILATLIEEDKRGNLTDQQRDFARSIVSAGNDLLGIINDILDLSKIEARKLSLRSEPFEMGEILEGFDALFRPQAEKKGLQFVTAKISGDDAQLRAKTDRQRLEQIARNFIGNAIKFTINGSVRLEVGASEKPGWLWLAVEDTGVGVPEAKRDLIFQAFEQADGSVSRKFGGTGLGLTISRELAQLLGGEIRLRSEEGRGSRFTFEFPAELPEEIASAHETAAERLPAIGGLRPPTPGSPTPGSTPDPTAAETGAERALAEADTGAESAKTILVVEDDPTFRGSVADAVRSYGFVPIEAATAEIAIEIMKRRRPSALLLDIKLPGLSGMGLLETIKSDPQLRHIPVHMISGLEYQRNALRLGAMGYMSKPVTLDKVRSALGRIENLLDKTMKRVLIVEDDERQASAIRSLVEGRDVEIELASSGESALERAAAGRYDCIILDLALPDMSGFDLLESMNALSIALPPIVVYTGRQLSDDEEAFLQRFSESVIIKGAKSPERLLDEVNLFLHRVELDLPEDKQRMLKDARSQERAFAGKRVLLVDDDLRNAFALTAALEAKGLDVQVARDGVEAVAAVESDSSFDAVLMDLMMPRMDGFEAMRKIRALPGGLRLPIVALTAKAMKGDHEACIEAGANDYLPKPVNLGNLVSVLKIWLEPRGGFS